MKVHLRYVVYLLPVAFLVGTNIKVYDGGGRPVYLGASEVAILLGLVSGLLYGIARAWGLRGRALRTRVRRELGLSDSTMWIGLVDIQSAVCCMERHVRDGGWTWSHGGPEQRV